MTALPRSLQTLFVDAKNARAQQETPEAPGEYDYVLQAVDDFVDGLCRGEYTKELYWECIATDCEEDGDWDSAKAAYHNILDLEGDSRFHRWKVFNSLAQLHALLGEDDLAQKYFKAATKESKDDNSDVLCRQSLSQESWHLIRLGRIQPALILAREGLSTKTDDVADLMTAKLLTSLAMCFLAKGRHRKTYQLIQQAWQHLEVLRGSLDDAGVMQDATGVHGTYCTWWRVQAEYLRMMGDSIGELHALENSLDKARYVAIPSQLPGPFADARVMQTLLAITDALQRTGRADEASVHLAEADAIQRFRKLPVSARSASLVSSRPDLRTPRLKWWYFGR